MRLPDVEIGTHCFDPRPCPFLGRCWPQSRDHIIKLYNVGPKTAWDYMRRGIHWISDIHEKEKLPEAGKRQLKTMRLNRLVVEQGLAVALEPFNEKLGFLDFETVCRAIVDGMVASVEIARLLFVAHKIPADERDRIRQDLLDYCERDTWAMVKLLEKLRASRAPGHEARPTTRPPTHDT